MPTAGKPLSLDDVEMILDAVRLRKRNFPTEPEDVTMLLVLLNIGDRYTSVACINGEWVGQKQDIPKGEGIPMCPNGHVLTQSNTRLAVGWVSSTEA